MNWMYDFFDNIDPKTKDWPLVATPWPTISLVAVYLFLVKIGPKIMEDRKPFDFKWVLVIYNFALVLLSAYMVYEVRISTENFCTCICNVMCTTVVWLHVVWNLWNRSGEKRAGNAVEQDFPSCKNSPMTSEYVCAMWHQVEERRKDWKSILHTNCSLCRLILFL